MAGESFRLKLGSVGPGHSKNRNVQVEAGRLTWHGVCQVHKLNTESDFRMSDQGNAMTSVQEFKSGWRVLLVAAMGVTPYPLIELRNVTWWQRVETLTHSTRDTLSAAALSVGVL